VLLLVLGVVLVAIFRIRISLPITPVGVRKKLIPGRFQVCLHTPVVRHALGLARAVLILAIRLAMLVLVRLVLPWVRHRIVSVV
jgi:hypothetical protein